MIVFSRIHGWNTFFFLYIKILFNNLQFDIKREIIETISSQNQIIFNNFSELLKYHDAF